MTKDKPSPLDEEVELKNGSTEARVVVERYMQSFGSLDFPAFHALVLICRRPEYATWDRKAFQPDYEQLLEAGFIEPKTEGSNEIHVHDSLRNVVMSAANGSGIGLTLVSPYADQD